MIVKIRPLRIEDAETSYKWRNNPEIWKYTGSKPDKPITYEIEHNWLKSKLSKIDEKRYAICVGENETYIGNVQLTNITASTAEFHIFIGETSLYGKGIGTEATIKLLSIGFEELKLEEIYLYVDEKNSSALKSYLKCGFKSISKDNSTIKMCVLSGK